ncbi:MAG: DUF1847 domain-containing protein [[Clostridium] symbiosum]|nr:DUF1847 domain-containing protein [[Clostridium] symbiosum]KAA6140403.1 DUF1847 domain-containing protein [[Clostridium] symbiosum]MCR1938645.1 DUF1847 domain-containing protein [[Clostridium] symbiosum]MDU7662029.1 DUF1847 domain-containing protein [[Clostridium] symbiosum]
MYTCTDCGLTGCRKEDGNYPPFCLTMQTESGELDEIAALYASDSIDGTIARASAKIEGNYYCRKTRVEETVLFIKAIGAKRVGIATCAGLINEAKTFSKILKKNGIDHVSVICKVGSRDKTEMGLPEEDKIKPGTFEPMCNPVLQARYLNRAGTDLNIVIGLCVGHDALFNKHSEAPVTTLIAKDRVLGHNPVAALYCHYYDKLYKP